MEKLQLDSIEIQLADDYSFIDFRFRVEQFKDDLDYYEKINSLILDNIHNQLAFIELFTNQKISQSELSSIVKITKSFDGVFLNAILSLISLKSKNDLLDKFCIWLNFRQFDGMKGIDFGNFEISFSPLRETSINLYTKFLDENIKSMFIDLQPKICELLPSLLRELLLFEVAKVIFLKMEEFDYNAEKSYNASYVINPIK